MSIFVLITKSISVLLGLFPALLDILPLQLFPSALLGSQPDKCFATAASLMQREELSSSGLLCNEEKSHWTPMHIGEWLGFAIDSISLSFRISEKKVSKLKGLLDSVIRAGYSSFRELARIAGTIISVALAVGPIFRLLTDRCISPLKPGQHGTTPFIFPPVFSSSSNFGAATSIALTVILLGNH